MISRDLMAFLRSQFALDWQGIHGAAHWARVRANGLRLATITGARRDVVELFAVLHDARRENDDYDPQHGARAAELAQSLRGTHLLLDDGAFESLAFACTYHSGGGVEGNATVQTCWDADRLDLGRVGIQPDSDRLCTAAAKDPEMIAWAWRRSLMDDGARSSL
jgi:uncharacterized protein